MWPNNIVKLYKKAEFSIKIYFCKQKFNLIIFNPSSITVTIVDEYNNNSNYPVISNYYRVLTEKKIIYYS